MTEGRGGRLARRLGAVVLVTAALGEGGHLLLEHAGADLLHHLFHLLFAGASVIAFLCCVAIDIRRNGFPTFSWRLHPERPKRL